MNGTQKKSSKTVFFLPFFFGPRQCAPEISTISAAFVGFFSFVRSEVSAAVSPLLFLLVQLVKENERSANASKKKKTRHQKEKL